MNELYRALFFIPDRDPEERKNEVVEWLFAQPDVDNAFYKVKTIYSLSNSFWLENSDIPTKTILQKSLKSKQDNTLVDRLSDVPYPTLNEVRYLFEKAVSEHKKEKLSKILLAGSSDLSGEDIDPDKLRNEILSQILDMDSGFDKTIVGGNFKDEAHLILTDYHKSKNNEEVGNPTGFKAIDDATRGIKKGELWFVSAFTGEGKSMFLTNLMWTNAVLFGRNVIYASGEMPRRQIRNWVLGRHSQHEKFSGIGTPLNISDIRDGKLSKAEERFFFDTVVPDLTSNPDYGQMEVFQIYPGMTATDLYRTLKYYRTKMDIDLVIIDMVQHLSTDSAQDKWQIELQETIKRLKQMSITFNDGEGLALVTGYQVSREAREKAEKMNEYPVSGLAYTAEAERSADVSIWILRKDEYKPRKEVRIGMNKNRSGSPASPFMAIERYDKGYVGDYPDGKAPVFEPEKHAKKFVDEGKYKNKDAVRTKL